MRRPVPGSCSTGLTSSLSCSLVFSHERFWWDNLAQPIQTGESPASIQANFKAVLAQLRKDQQHIEQILANDSERDRHRILDAYAQVPAEIRKQYPDLAKEAS